MATADASELGLEFDWRDADPEEIGRKLRDVLSTLPHYYRPLEEFLRHFRYKPGWTFTLRNHPSHPLEVQLQITMHVRNSRDPDSPNLIPVVGEFAAPFMPDLDGSDDMLEDVYLHWIRDAIQFMEKHEIDEWIRYKNELPFDPHRRSDNGEAQPEF